MIVKQHAEAIARFETKKESAEGLLEKKKKEKRAAEEALSEATGELSTTWSSMSMTLMIVQLTQSACAVRMT